MNAAAAPRVSGVAWVVHARPSAMLECLGADSFVATCDACGAVAPTVTGIRELAVTRLMLQGWHLRTKAGATICRCPSCRPTTFPGTPPSSR